jgi:hypothetical protein
VIHIPNQYLSINLKLFANKIFQRKFLVLKALALPINTSKYRASGSLHPLQHHRRLSQLHPLLPSNLIILRFDIDEVSLFTFLYPHERRHPPNATLIGGRAELRHKSRGCDAETFHYLRWQCEENGRRRTIYGMHPTNLLRRCCFPIRVRRAKVEPIADTAMRFRHRKEKPNHRTPNNWVIHGTMFNFAVQLDVNS